MAKREKSGIQKWAEEDRPRERMMQHGVHSLSDSELMAILIGSGNKQESAVELSRRILAHADNKLTVLGKFSIKDLTKFKGIGEAKAITIASALELGRRRKETETEKECQIRCSNDIFEYLHTSLSNLSHEEFWALLLNKKNVVIHKAKISQGGVDGTFVDVKILLKTAIENLATGLIVCHNHPSGNLFPSKTDIDITKKIKNACETMEITFFDHLIIAGDNYYSFADEGKINP